jgi:hypothetical protein
MEPPDVEVVSVRDSFGRPLSVFPVPFPLLWQHQQSVRRRPIQPGNRDEAIVDLVYRRENGSITFACDIQTATGNIGWIPIPITGDEVFFCVWLTAPHAQPKDQWFKSLRDPAAALMFRVVPVSTPPSQRQNDWGIIYGSADGFASDLTWFGDQEYVSRGHKEGEKGAGRFEFFRPKFPSRTRDKSASSCRKAWVSRPYM